MRYGGLIGTGTPFSNPLTYGPFSNPSSGFGFSNNGFGGASNSAFSAVTNNAFGTIGSSPGYTNNASGTTGGGSYLGAGTNYLGTASGAVYHTSNNNYHHVQNSFGNAAGSSGNAFNQAPIGFSGGESHEARYAQYLAANENTLGNYTYGNAGLGGLGAVAGTGGGTLGVIGCPINSNSHGQSLDHSYMSSAACGMEDPNRSYRPNPNAGVIGKKPKKGRKGIDVLTTIDSVFTPKDIAEGDLDETERDVEAFTRFCYYNIPRNEGEKPKVNFDVQDIMIKKKDEL